MKCTCENPQCTIEVRFDSQTKTMIVERDDATILTYLDPNMAVWMIGELKKCLKAMTDYDV